MADIERDPQVNARNMIISMPHPELGKIRMAGSPLRLSETPVRYRHAPPPVPGQHRREILRELAGLDDAAIAAMISAEVICCWGTAQEHPALLACRFSASVGAAADRSRGV